MTMKVIGQSKPLQGLKILDFSRVLAGPWCTMLLGDAGATVIKVEKPGTGDETRDWGPPFVGGDTDIDTPQMRLSTYFLSVNRGKQSIAVDIQQRAGRAIGQRLATEWADVVVENFNRGTMEKFGLGYEELSNKNPRLVYCSISGFGATGPYASRPGYDVVVSGMYGLMSITGDEDGNPAKVGVASTDVLTGTLAHSGILSALYARDRTGVGQKVEVSLMESQLAGLVNIAASTLNAPPDIVSEADGSSTSKPPPPPKRWGTAHESIVPYQAFQCKHSTIDRDADPRYIMVGAGNDMQFTKLVSLLDRPDLIQDPRFQSNTMRVKHRKVLIPLLEEIFATKSQQEWMDLLSGRGFPLGPLRNVQESFQCEQAIHMGMVEEIVHPVVGKIRLPRTPITFSSSSSIAKPPGIDVVSEQQSHHYESLPPPMLGEHTAQILQHILQMNSQAIQEMENDRIIECWHNSESKH